MVKNAFLATLLALSFVTCYSSSAPIPYSKPEKKTSDEDILGGWTFTWGKVEGNLNLDKDGTYNCFWSGEYYTGTWKLEGKVLSVKETMRCEANSAYPGWIHWSVPIELDKKNKKQLRYSGKLKEIYVDFAIYRNIN